MVAQQSSSGGSLGAATNVDRGRWTLMGLEASQWSAPCRILATLMPASLSPWDSSPRTQRIHDRRTSSPQEPHTHMRCSHQGAPPFSFGWLRRLKSAPHGRREARTASFHEPWDNVLSAFW